MNKRLIAAVMSITLLSSVSALSSCGESADMIGVSLPNQATSLNVGIGNQVTNIFKPKGFNVKVQSAEDSATNQKQQLETFITMGVKMIVAAPVEMGTVQETFKKAREKGIKVVISGTSSIEDGAYDAVTVSNEYLVGNYIGLLAKHWVEDTFTEADSFSTLIMKSSLAADPIARSNGMCSIKEKYLKNNDGEYIDINNKVVTEAEKVENPAYCELVASHPIHEVEMGTTDTGKALLQNALLEDANVKVVLMYGSLFAPGASQHLCDTYSDVEKFGLFGGGVSGNEGAYLLGSLPDGIGETVTVGGNDYKGLKSTFRGAVSFGGEDAALSVAELAYNCYYGKEGVDYQKKTPETIGLWYTLNTQTQEALACFDISKEVVTDFDPVTNLTDENTVIKWQKSK